MKAVGYREPLPIREASSLLNIEVPKPSPQKRDLLVAVEAVSLNPVDVKVRASKAPEGSEFKILG